MCTAFLGLMSIISTISLKNQAKRKLAPWQIMRKILETALNVSIENKNNRFRDDKLHFVYKIDIVPAN